jgi:NADH-quinone oxidoreductase subunit D
MILSELSRISAHLAFLARLAKTVEADAMAHYALRDREKVLDLFELLTGARFSLNFMRVGGVSADVTEGFVERVFELCDLLRFRLKEYNDIFSFNQAFLRRTAGVGVLSRSLAFEHGISGPNARAAGVEHDIRKQYPYSGFDRADLSVPCGHGEAGVLGDVHDRLLVRLREIAESAELLRYLAEELPDGALSSVSLKKGDRLPAGEAYSRVESARGCLAFHVVSDGSEFPNRIQIKSPSQAVISALPKILCGNSLEDLALILASLDLSLAEADR